MFQLALKYPSKAADVVFQLAASMPPKVPEIGGTDVLVATLVVKLVANMTWYLSPGCSV